MKYTNTPAVTQQCIICEPGSRTKAKLPAPLNPAMQYRTAPGRDLTMNCQQTWANLSPRLPLGEAARCYRQIPYSLMKMTIPPEKSQENMNLNNQSYGTPKRQIDGQLETWRLSIPILYAIRCHRCPMGKYGYKRHRDPCTPECLDIIQIQNVCSMNSLIDAFGGCSLAYSLTSARYKLNGSWGTILK